ncbi:MAG: LacI family transcriptional regulator [Propionibacteriaceae bacterium]|jgi:LacI family transcriptional regulator|nr:LacI family transcriptional regulator [Propionibacteriaceae bacterium]
MRANGLDVTMADVAKAAGVSRPLVSIVMRGVPGASDSTRQHVMKVAAELGYVPDVRAQALRRQGPGAVGVAFEAVQPFHAALVDGVYETCESAGRELVLTAVTASHDESKAIDSLLANRCGAIVAIGSGLPPRRLAQIAALVPVVVVARAVRAEAVEYVCSDDEGSLVKVVEHLVGLGHSRICFAASPRSGGGPQRLRGYRKAMAAAALSVDVVEAGSTEQAGADAAARLLARGQLPTAVIGFNDPCAAGLQASLRQAGLRVPEDISITGFDDSAIAATPYRQLTSVRQDTARMAETAALRAIARMEGQSERRRSHVLPTALTIRASTAPPPR